MATARELRPGTTASLRAGFAERGWTSPRSGAAKFRLPAGDGLTVRWSPRLVGDAHGGIRFGGSGTVSADDVTARLLSFPEDALPADVVRWPPADRSGYCSLAVETAGGLVHPRGDHHAWVVRTTEEAAPALDAFFAMVDGPLQPWIRSVTPVAVLLDWALTGPLQMRGAEIGVDAMAVLAMEHGRPDVARSVLRGFPVRNGAQRATLARFAQELLARYPAYGAPER